MMREKIKTDYKKLENSFEEHQKIFRAHSATHSDKFKKSFEIHSVQSEKVKRRLSLISRNKSQSV